MKWTLTQSEFIEQFRKIRPDNFSYDGLKAIYEYYEEFEDMEFDPIAICCEWTEFDELSEQDLESQFGISTLRELCDNTTVILEKGLLLVQEF